jgi:hypothetical protein
MDIRAKYRAYGFRKKFWETGEIARNVTEEEFKMPEMKHFEPVGGGKIPVPVKDEQPITLKEMGEQSELILKTNRELKALLDGKGIQYPPTANKAMLIELLTRGGE